VLEDLWRVTTGRDREFYQGLIQLAVVLHHVRNGNVRGATNVLATCRRHLAPYEPEWGGVDVSKLLEFCNRIEAGLAQAEVQGRPPVVPADIPRLTAGKG
jgi:predicted metal-dependent hydrolase